MMKIDFQDIDQVVNSLGRERKSIIPILQAIQAKYNYLPQEAIERLCEISEITASEIMGVASFYSQFRLQPAGKHIIKVCVGTACHVKGASLVYESFQRNLKLSDGATTDAAGKYSLEKVSCLGCCTLAPVVQIDNITYGHVIPRQIDEILADFELQKGKSEKQQFRTAKGEELQGEIRVGLGSCCIASGSNEVRKEIEKVVASNHLNVKIKNVGCVGMCHQVPLVELAPINGETQLFAKVRPEDVKSIIESKFRSLNPVSRLINSSFKFLSNIQNDSEWAGVERHSIHVSEKRVADFLGNQLPMATEHRGENAPLDYDEFVASGGLQGFKKALSMSPDDIIQEIIVSGLKGRGGAGFPTGKKWEIVATEQSDEKILICNGDEGDPGAFMDRMLLESYPFRIIEGILIAARATNIRKGYFYIRAEYPLAVKRVAEALQICREKGVVGKNILNSGMDFEIEIYQGAGAFVCGEETALIASIEGRRGYPQIRPPFPAQEGLWGKPTLVNNTETFALVSYILRNGSQSFNLIGTDNSKGTKVFALTGKISRGGLIEVPMGISIRKIVEEIGGGIANGHTFKAIQIGGPSGGCIPHWLADTAIDFQSLKESGAMMGSGGLVVLDDTDCMVDIARYFLSFTQHESCGKCTFCRIGTRRMLDILERICSGKGKEGDLEELEKLANATKKGSLCGLGKTAPNPILSTLKYFRDEYEAHLKGVCPSGKCKDLIMYTVNDQCIGCTKCAQQCPVDAIEFKPHEKHFIKQDLCIKCDTCKQICPADAISVG